MQGFARRVASEGALLDPDAASSSDSMPPSGSYVCRQLRLGGMPALTVLPSVPCVISAGSGLLSLTVLKGAQRPRGKLLPSGSEGLIFLGSMAVGDETRVPIYGSDRSRDMVGRLERVGATQWRLVLPRPSWGGMIDIIELIPQR
jgi:hypothetical protein